MKGDPTTYKVLEVYESDEAFAAHRGAEHMKVGVAEFMPLLSGKPQIEVLDAPGA